VGAAGTYPSSLGRVVGFPDNEPRADFKFPISRVDRECALRGVAITVHTRNFQVARNLQALQSTSDGDYTRFGSPEHLKEVVFACETFCVAGCCGLDAFDLDARIIHWRLQSLPRFEVLKQSDALMQQIASHDGPVSSSEDLYRVWENANDCLDYLSAWRWEIVCAMAGRLERIGSPKERLIEARTHGRYAFAQEIQRLRRECGQSDESRIVEVDLLVATFDEHDPLIRQSVLDAQQELASRGVAPYSEANARPCPCTKS
jgi:hypothetical protein